MADLKTLKDVRFLQKELKSVDVEDQVKICKIFKQLSKLPVSVDILQATGIGKLVNNYRKCGGKVTDYSRFLVQKWKDVLIKETQSKGKHGHHGNGGNHSESEDDREEEEEEREPHHQTIGKDRKEEGKSPKKNKYSSPMKGLPSKDRQSSYRNELPSKGSEDSHKKQLSNKTRDDSSKGGLPNMARYGSPQEALPNKARYGSPKDGLPNKVKHGSPMKDVKSLGKHKHDRHYEQDNDVNHEPTKLKMSHDFQTDVYLKPPQKDNDHKFKVKKSRESMQDYARNDDIQVTEKSTQQHELKKKDTEVVKKSATKRKLPKKVNKEEITHDSGMSFAECLNLDAPVPKKVIKQDKVKVTIVPMSSTSHAEQFLSETVTKETDVQYPVKKHKEKKKHKHKHKEHGKEGREKKHKRRHGEKSVDGVERQDDRIKNRSSDGKKRKEEVMSPDQSMTKKLKNMTSPTDFSGSLPSLTLNPDYKPLRLPQLDDLPRRKTFGMDDAALTTVSLTSKQSRTKVFSGRARLNVYDHVPSLYDTCMRVLCDNIDLLEDVGGVPFDILQPVLERCTAEQLFRLEDFNPHFLEDTEDLWHKHVCRDFKGSIPDEFETWREVYLRKIDERKVRLEKITANIQASMAQKRPERQLKLAFMSGPAKPPREVQRRQARLGTAGPVSQHKSPHKPSASAFKPRMSGSGGSFRESHSGADGPRAVKPVKIIPPMMMKSLKMMRGLKR
ncbi:uncharacterized protein LOC144444919 [Glandiceps talaboti]